MVLKPDLDGIWVKLSVTAFQEQSRPHESRAEAGDQQRRQRAAGMKPALFSGLTLHEPELQVSAPCELFRIHPDKLFGCV